MALIRARQPGITRVLPHRGNRRYAIPNKARYGDPVTPMTVTVGTGAVWDAQAGTLTLTGPGAYAEVTWPTAAGTITRTSWNWQNSGPIPPSDAGFTWPDSGYPANRIADHFGALHFDNGDQTADTEGYYHMIGRELQDTSHLFVSLPNEIDPSTSVTFTNIRLQVRL